MTEDAAAKAGEDPRDALVKRLKELSLGDIENIMRDLRAHVASQLEPWVDQANEVLDRARPYAEALLTIIQASFSAFGRAGWVIEAYHDSHWDLYRAFSRNKEWLGQLRLKPFHEYRPPGVEAVATRLLDRLQGIPLAAVVSTESGGGTAGGRPHEPLGRADETLLNALHVYVRDWSHVMPAALYAGVSTVSAIKDPARAELAKQLCELFRQARGARP
jgi:hypothetical protein